MQYSRRCAPHFVVRDVRNPPEANIRTLDAPESGKQRQDERGGGKEYGSIGQEIADKAHKTRREHPSRRSESLIASEPFAKRRVAYQAKADGGDRQPQESARDPLEHQSSQHQPETRP
ncbi:MAG: hypothetical protein WAN43_20755 [Rhodomicrobium sp.]